MRVQRVNRTDEKWPYSHRGRQYPSGDAFHVGDRRRESDQELWVNIPVAYREQARFHTDQYEAYKSVMPVERHQAMTKHARKTNHIERFNTTLRQRLSRWYAKCCRAPRNWPTTK